MEILRKVFLSGFCLFIGVCMWNENTLLTQAEEMTPPGYHVYTTTEKEVIDTWYGISRGNYLVNGSVGLVEAGKGKVNVSGTTNARMVCDKVKVAVYLDEGTSSGSSFGTIGSYYYTETNATICYGTKSNISVTSGRWYMVRGVHTVMEGSTTETTDTQTSAMKVS